MERMRKAVMQGVEEQSSMMKKLFKIAYDYKLKYVKMGKDTPILNKSETSSKFIIFNF